MGPPYNKVSYQEDNGNIVTLNTGEILNDPENYPIVVHPVDKTDNYIKRCVGVAGETIEIKDDIVYINGEKQNCTSLFTEMNYTVTVNALRHWIPEVMKE